MRLYTSYYANYRKFPPDAIQVAISLVVPDGFKGKTYKAVAPSSSILNGYKNDANEERYVQRYESEVLGNLDQDEVVEDIFNIVDDDNATVIFLCFERSDKFCHRHLFAKWLNEAGYECEELM